MKATNELIQRTREFSGPIGDIGVLCDQAAGETLVVHDLANEMKAITALERSRGGNMISCNLIDVWVRYLQF